MKRYSRDALLMHYPEGMREDDNGDWVKYEDVHDMFGDKCDSCGEWGQDRRTLSMACGYEMKEINVPFIERNFENVPSFGRTLYTLFVCKDCRGRWMKAIKDWFERKGE